MALVNKGTVKNILVITTWDYKSGLIQSSTLPYLKMIHTVTPTSKIYLVTQEKSDWYRNTESLEIDRSLSEHNIYLYPQQYSRFGIRKLISSGFQFLQLLWLIVRKKISHLHCFCTPAGAVGYMLSTLTGCKLIIDSYEPHAESMVENGTWSKEGKAFKMLWSLEKKQTEKAHYLIAAASGMKEYAKTKWGSDLKHWGVRPACVDLDHFQFNAGHRERIRKMLGWEDKYVAVYAGKFGGIYLDKEVFDFMKTAEKMWGDKLRLLLLTNHEADEIKELCQKAGFSYTKVHHIFSPHQEVAYFLSAADFALTPVKPVPSKKYCTPIKDGEYWAIGLPVVITRNISDDSDIIQENEAGAVIQNLDKLSYQHAIEKIDVLLNGPRELLRKRIRRLAETYRNYDIAKQQYENAYREYE
jgi:glycosyltransferase involved in cell wall biosynthesis